ncbi:hypothetical protein [Kibdelosporangium aridum]|nr:hypothetical protein [Kibdelosporangium aridum]
MRRVSEANGLRIWVDGDLRDEATRVDAVARFQTLLGILRAWRSEAGELRDEQRAGLGEGPVCDEAGNQFLSIGPVRTYTTFGGEIEWFAECTRRGVGMSQHLRNALWLNGRLNRTAADFYMIHEYAGVEFGGSLGIRDKLKLSTNSQGRLTRAANNLSPLEGGRHAKQSGEAGMTLDEQRTYVADLLRRWINLHSAA